MTHPAIARRILLRLDPDRRGDGGMLAAVRLAAALHAELAARLVSDTRVADALAFASQKPATSLEALLKRAEASLRRTIATLAEQERAAWSFEVVECAGILAAGGGVETDDLVAIELSRAGVAMSDLREEVEKALDSARGVLLFPSGEEAAAGPIVVVAAEQADPRIIGVGEDIAAALRAPIAVLDRSADAGSVATGVRRRKAALAVVDAADPLAHEFLARPRFLRELATPLLLLKS